MLILVKEPNNLIIFDLKNNQIISIINGLSGDLILELINSKNILIVDEGKIIVFNYITYSLINVHFFDEITFSENLIKKDYKNITYDNEHIYYSVIYKKNRLGEVNCLQLNYLIKYIKEIKYDYFLDEEDNIIDLKKK